MAKTNRTNSKSHKQPPQNKGNKFGRGKKPPYKTGRGNRADRQTEEIADTAAAMSRENPVQLYTKYDQFAHDAARVSFTRPLGTIFNEEFYSEQNEAHTTKRATPGIMRISFSPAIGVSNDITSPINRSSINFYARLRSTQKAFGDYDHQDSTMMMIGIDSAIMFHALGRRIYGLLRDMTPVNKYYCEALIAACGVDFHTTIQEIQDFRAWLNEYALQIEQYALPKNINLFERHQWMCEGIYTDGSASRAQTYVFVPAGFWRYNNTAETGSQLDYVAYLDPSAESAGVAPYVHTLDTFKQMGQSLIAAMSNDADFATISGDLYAYYGGDVFKLPYVDETYQILPRYDETVLSQIENAVIAGPFAEAPTISQNPAVNNGAILFQPYVCGYPTTYDDTKRAIWLSNPSMNFHVESPSEDLVIEATRLMVAFGPGVTETGYVKIPISRCGTEIVHSLDIFQLSTNTSLRQYSMYRINRQILPILDTSTPQQVSYITSRILNLAQFDWAPRVCVCIINTSITPNSYVIQGDTWDRETTDHISETNLETITTACLYSLFNIETR